MTIKIQIERVKDGEKDITPFEILGGLAAAASEALEDGNLEITGAMIDAFGSLCLEWHEKYENFREKEEAKEEKH